MPDEAVDRPPDVPSYVLGERLGAGGFGEVFAARHPLIGRDVAIKVLHAKYSENREAVARFIAEARAVNRISHPAIVEIFDFGQLPDGRHYCVMERLHGTTLRDLLRERGSIPLDEALPMLQAIAEAIDAAHAAGIAHRDLKPDNVFLLKDGAIKLIDFGLAKLSGEATAITETGSVFGTPLYMSPEQCRGGASTVATDAYSFGALAYHVLVGEPPFSGDPLALALHHLNDSPTAPSSRKPALDTRVDRVVAALMAKDSTQRPMPLASAISSLRGTAPLPPKPRTRRQARWWGLGGALVAGGAILFAVTRADEPVITTDLPAGCLSSAEMLAHVWDPPARAVAQAHFASVNRPDVAATWKVMSDALDAQFGKWAQLWTTACTGDERRTDPLLNAQRLACLERNYYELRGHAETLGTVDPGTYSYSFLDETVPFVGECEKVSILRAEPAQVLPEKRVEAATHMRPLFASSLAFWIDKDRERVAIDLRARTKAAAEALEKLGSPMASVGWLAHASRIPETDLSEYRRVSDHALDRAEKDRFDLQVFKISLARARVERNAGNYAEAKQALARARRAVAPFLEAAPYLGDMLDSVELVVELRAGKSTNYARAVVEPVWKDRPLPAGQVYQECGGATVWLMDGQPALSLDAANKAVTHAEQLLGPSHQIPIYCYGYVAHAYALLERPRDAFGTYGKALDWYKQVEGSWDAQYLSILRSGLALRMGDPTTAETELAAAHRYLTNVAPAERWLNAAGMAQHAGELGVAATAIEHARGEVAATAAGQRDLASIGAMVAFDRQDKTTLAATSIAYWQAGPPDNAHDAIPWFDLVSRARDRDLAGVAKARVVVDRFRPILTPLELATALAYEAVAAAHLGAKEQARELAIKATAVLNGNIFDYDFRLVPLSLIALVLIDIGEDERARVLCEELMGTSARSALSGTPVLVSFAQFGLATILWKSDATKDRAIRIAKLARLEAERVAPYRKPQRDAMSAWLANPTKGLTVSLLP